MMSFASAQEYRDGGFSAKGKSDGELEALLARASRSIRSEVKDVDARIVGGTLDPMLVADIACEMAETVIASEGGPSLQSLQQTAGPFGQTATYSNPRGDLFLTAKHKRQLAPSRKRRAFTVRVGGHAQ